MTARAIGDVLAGRQGRGDSPRSGEAVWRNSYTDGTIEDRIWRPIGDGSRRGARRRIGAVVKSARALEARTRRERQKSQPGCRNGILGHIGVAVLEALYNIVDFKTGRLEPAIASLAEMVGHSYQAVHSALRRLRAAGFLHWVRRSRPLENKGEAGPQVEQITNAYALFLPKPVEDMVRRLIGKGPAPDDASWAREQQKAQWREMLDALDPADFVDAIWTGDRLRGETLKRIGELIDARDSRERESSTSGETGVI